MYVLPTNLAGAINVLKKIIPMYLLFLITINIKIK